MIEKFVLVITWLLLLYVVVLQIMSTLLVVLGWRRCNDYVRRRPLRSYSYVAESRMSMPVSILVPAYNEGKSTVASVKALIESQFSQLEIVVVNDGSKDDTREQMIRGFDMVEM